MDNTIFKENSELEIDKLLRSSKELGKSINFIAKVILVISWIALFCIFCVVIVSFQSLSQDMMKNLVIVFLISLLGTIPGYLIFEAIGHGILLKVYILEQLKNKQ